MFTVVISVAKWSYRLLLVLLILVKGLPRSVSRVEKHPSVLPVYFKLQPAEVNCYTGLVLERFETLPLLETKYDIFLALYITQRCNVEFSEVSFKRDFHHDYLGMVTEFKFFFEYPQAFH